MFLFFRLAAQPVISPPGNFFFSYLLVFRPQVSGWLRCVWPLASVYYFISFLSVSVFILPSITHSLFISPAFFFICMCLSSCLLFLSPFFILFIPCSLSIYAPSSVSFSPFLSFSFFFCFSSFFPFFSILFIFSIPYYIYLFCLSLVPFLCVLPPLFHFLFFLSFLFFSFLIVFFPPFIFLIYSFFFHFYMYFLVFFFPGLPFLSSSTRFILSSTSMLTLLFPFLHLSMYLFSSLPFSLPLPISLFHLSLTPFPDSLLPLSTHLPVPSHLSSLLSSFILSSLGPRSLFLPCRLLLLLLPSS